jgi:flagellar hook protein FlgE
MSFNTALTGINAAQADLGVTANNVANANTTGFKQSRAQFADFFPLTGFGLSETAIGGGARVSSVAQQFSQGAITFTNNSLDLAISGEGFFTVSNGGSLEYTRAGAFGTDRNGFIVNATGARLQAFPSIGGGNFNTALVSDVQVSSADNPPAATGQVTAGFNLPADAALPATGTFSSADPTSYNHTTSATVFDSLGAAHTINLFFVKTATANEWALHTEIDGATVSGPDTLTFSNTGQLTAPAGGTLTLPAYTPTSGAADLNLTLNIGNSTQFGGSFGVGSLTQDGYATGRLAGVSISAEGVVQARYTNGQVTPLGKLALANFANPQGLQQLGNGSWGETFSSGPVIRGQAGTTSFGQIQAGALEASNVDLTQQLVNMITAQRNFQANAQMIQASDQITQTIINIR